ncbi:MAG: hypothetical protein ABS79_01410 [Planctomycetes bacterium SCN 63-9]|nr:MAG: hypothetical protein ABS79_01410 [Planctomycetes bacterium SCN 63-9]
MVRLHYFKHLALIAGLTFASASSASAGTLQIDLDIGIDTFSILDNGSFDTDLTPNVIVVDVSQFNGFIAGFGYTDLTFKSLSANSNNPGANSGASIKINSDAVAALNAAVQFTLTTFQTGFIIPTGIGNLASSAGGSWTQTDTNDSATFQSAFQNTLFTTKPTSVSPDTGGFTASYNSSSPLLPLGIVTAPFSLWNQTTITISSTADLEAENQFTGTTVLRAVAIPEPSSVIMMLSAVPAVMALRRFRGR